MTSHHNRRDPDSPSTSYKSSLDTPAEEDQLPSLTLVNPCHAAPASFVELQPFSSRLSRQGQGQGYQNTDLEGRGQVGIAEEGDHEKGAMPSQSQDGAGEEEEDIGPVMSKARLFLIASGMLLTYFLGTASSAAVTLMIPDIARSLDISELEAQWVSSAYTLAYGCGLLFAGRMSDMYGRKMLYLGGLSTFLVFSIISALIRNRIGLCVVRAICGLGLAVASPAGFGIVGVTFRKEPERTIAFAAFGLGAPLGAGTGTLIGGAIASTGDRGWTYLFYLLAGVALVPIIIGIFVIPKDKALRDVTQDRRIDWIGGFIVTAGLCLFCFSLTESGIAEKGWATPYVPTLLVLSVLLLVVFGFWERHLERNTTFPPIVKFSLFTRHQYKVLVIVVSTFFIVISVYGFVYLITIFYQSHLGLSPLDTAIRTLPCTIVGCVAAGSVMWLGPRYKAPVLLYIGISVGSLSTLLFAVEPRGTIYWACQFIALCFLPWGIDFTVCLGNVMMSNLVEEDEQSVGGAIFQTSIQIGASLGICLASLVSTIRTEATGDLVRGLKDGFWMLTVFAWIVLVVIFFGLRKVGLARDVRGPRGSGKDTTGAH